MYKDNGREISSASSNTKGMPRIEVQGHKNLALGALGFIQTQPSSGSAVQNEAARIPALHSAARVSASTVAIRIRRPFLRAGRGHPVDCRIRVPQLTSMPGFNARARYPQPGQQALQALQGMVPQPMSIQGFDTDYDQADQQALQAIQGMVLQPMSMQGFDAGTGYVQSGHQALQAIHGMVPQPMSMQGFNANEGYAQLGPLVLQAIQHMAPQPMSMPGFGAGADYVQSDQQALQAIQGMVLQPMSMPGFDAGAGHIQSGHQALQAIQGMVPQPMSTADFNADTGYGQPGQQASQAIQASLTQAKSMKDFMKTSLAGGTDGMCIFSPPLQDPPAIQGEGFGRENQQTIFWEMRSGVRRPPKRRYSKDEKTAIRCLHANELSYSDIKKMTGSPKGTTSRFCGQPNQVQMVRIESRKRPGICSFVLTVRFVPRLAVYPP